MCVYMQSVMTIICPNTPPRDSTSLPSNIEARVVNGAEGRILVNISALGEYICNVVLVGDENEREPLELDLFAEPRHLDVEVTIAGGDNVVPDHGYTCLIVFEESSRSTWRKVELGEKVAEPQDIFTSFGCCDEFSLGRAETHS